MSVEAISAVSAQLAATVPAAPSAMVAPPPDASALASMNDLLIFARERADVVKRQVSERR